MMKAAAEKAEEQERCAKPNAFARAGIPSRR
jgi:hypothetical protein